MTQFLAGISPEGYWDALFTVPAYRNFTVIYVLVIGGLITAQARFRHRRKLPQWPVGLAIALYTFIFMVIAPVIVAAQPALSRNVLQADFKRVSICQLMYAGDHDDRLPLASNWETIFLRGKEESGDIHVACVGTFGEKSRLTYNSLLSSFRVADIVSPDRTVMLFSSKLPGPNASSSDPAIADRIGNRVLIFGSASGGSNQTSEDFVWKPD